MVYKGKGVFRKVFVVWNKIWKVLGCGGKIGYGKFREKMRGWGE